jgi:hypothetical protein
MARVSPLQFDDRLLVTRPREASALSLRDPHPDRMLAPESLSNPWLELHDPMGRETPPLRHIVHCKTVFVRGLVSQSKLPVAATFSIDFYSSSLVLLPLLLPRWRGAAVLGRKLGSPWDDGMPSRALLKFFCWLLFGDTAKLFAPCRSIAAVGHRASACRPRTA